MSKIKFPVRGSKHTPIYILDAEGSFLFPIYERAQRNEIIHRLNGYGVAVEALRELREAAREYVDIVSNLQIDDDGAVDITFAFDLVSARERLEKALTADSGELDEQEDKT